MDPYKLICRKPIEAGLAANAPDELKAESRSKQLELNKEFGQYVHRKDATCVRKALPEFHDTLLYIQASKTQSKLMRIYDKDCEKNRIGENKNFFR